MQPKQLLTTFLLVFFPTPASFIISPSGTLSFSDITKQIREDFSEWDAKRNDFVRFSRDYPFGWPTFDCNPVVEEINVTSVKNVHQLSPWHISVIGALGDSLTAGRAAEAEKLEDILLDYREISFVSGAKNNLSVQASLFNIFRHFSPNLKGASSASGSREYNDDFNVAVSGSFTANLPDQARTLISRLKAHPDVDFDNDWKFINVLIGSNDLCRICENQTNLGVDQYVDNLKSAILYLKANLPRAYINVVPPFFSKLFDERQYENPFCVDIHRLSCPCLFEIPVDEHMKIKRSFNEALLTFHDAQFQQEDFAVAISSDLNIDHLAILGNSPNLAFLALDCFHFSNITHDLVAKMIWSDLFGTIGYGVRDELNTFQPQTYRCPPQSCPYLKTTANSINCTAPVYPGMSVANRKVIFDGTAPLRILLCSSQLHKDEIVQVYFPSLGELERRAFMEENGLMFLLVIAGLLAVFLVACALIMRCSRRSPKNIHPTERTRLLQTKFVEQDF
ncbi:hypothetical protein Q1695_013033 [Nippostrongylus brasiliensis]|nr:hypothetical protein Q1695_013033 [Nippostrongylus brasiliensis]